MDLNKFSTFNIILVILFIVYSLTMFLLFDSAFLDFKISFIFTLIAFILQFALMRYFNNKLNDSTQLTNVSAFFVADIYLFLQNLISIIFNIIHLNFIYSIIIQVIILAIVIIIELLLIQSIDYIDSVENKKDNQIKFQKTILKRIEILKAKYPNCNELESLYETVRYSNPVSTGEVKVLETGILKNLNTLEEFLSQKDKENSLNALKNIQEDFHERDIILNK